MIDTRRPSASLGSDKYVRYKLGASPWKSGA